MDLRQQKGMQIAKQKTIKPTNGGWLVKSQTSDNAYKISENFVCNCPDSTCRGVTCKHSYAVRYYLEVEKETANGLEKERVPLIYKQAWKAYNEAQTQEIRLFDKLLGIWCGKWKNRPKQGAGPA